MTGRTRAMLNKVPAATAIFWLTKSLATMIGGNAFILTRPLGATVGDDFAKPVANRSLALGRFDASAALAAVIVFCILLIPQRAGRHPGVDERAA